MTYACVESEIKYLAINFVHMFLHKCDVILTCTVEDTHFDQ